MNKKIQEIRKIKKLCNEKEIQFSSVKNFEINMCDLIFTWDKTSSQYYVAKHYLPGVPTRLKEFSKNV